MTTRQNNEVARLDRSKPPEGYHVAWSTHGVRVREWSFVSPGGPRLPRPVDGLDDLAIYATEAEAIAAAWTHHEARHDPPGMDVFGDDTHGWFCEVTDPPQGGSIGPGSKPDKWYGPDTLRTEAEARAAAWAWYWRRVALDLFGEFDLPSMWPRALTWSDEHVAEAERWLAEGGEMPEVLRG